MFCEKCGAQIPEDAALCPACGQVNSREQTPAEGWEMPPSKKSSGGKIALIIVGAVVALALLVGGILLLTGLAGKLKDRMDAGKDTPGTTPSTSEQGGNTDKKDETDSTQPTQGNTAGNTNYTVTNDIAEEKKDVVVASVGSQELTNGELQAYYWSAVSEFINYYGGYISYTGLDLAKPFHEQVYDEKTGETFQQMFLEMALDNWYYEALLKQMAVDANYDYGQGCEAYLKAIQTQLEDYMAEYKYTDKEKFIDEQFFPGSSYELYLKHIELNYMSYTYYNHLYNSQKPTMEQMEAYYKEHEAEYKQNKIDKAAGDYYNVRHILVGIEGEADSSGNYSDAQWAACKASAEKLLNQFKSGAATEEAFAQLAMAHSQDPGSAENGGLYADLTKDTNFIDTFKNWYMDAGRKPGDTGIVQNTQSSVQGYHIMYFVSSAPVWETEVKTAIQSEYAEQQIEAAKAKWSMAVDYEKVVLSTVDLAS